MANSKVIPKITEKSVIRKYAVGADPKVDKPYEVVAGPNKVYEGLAALQKMKSLGYDISQYQ